LQRDLLTITEVSEMTGTPVPTLRWWRAINSGGPKSGLLGGRVVYRLSDVQAWIDSAFEDGAA
jgi:predicted DNA-binding transcriptional regulator AlpA